jgi:hypothetical protein
MKAVLLDLGRVLIHYDHAKTLAAVGSLSLVGEVVVKALFREVARPLEVGELDAEGLY